MKKLTLLILGAASIGLASCGGSTSSSSGDNSNGNISDLSIVAPYSYPAGIAVSVPLVITNNGGESVANLSYAIDSLTNTAGGNIKLDPSSTAKCKDILAQESCVIYANIAVTPPSNSGSFAINITQTGHITQKIINLADTFSSAHATIGLDTVPSNNAVGADGVNLSFTPKLIANSVGTTSFIVTAFVNSPSAGNFNALQLVDQSGNVLNYKILTGNDGSGNLGQGSVVTFQMFVPSEESDIKFKLQTVENNIIQSTTTEFSSVKVLAPGVQAGILNLTPNYFDLSASHESQTITLSNIGNGSIKNLKLVPQDQLLVVSSNCGTTLSTGVSCQYTLKLNQSTSEPGKIIIVFTYNDGSKDQQQYATATVTNYTTPKYIFVTSQRYNGNLGGFSGADAKCTAVAANGNVTKNITSGWKAMLNGNNATTAGVEYKNTKNISLGTATGGNFVEPEYIPQNVFFSEDGYDAGISIWTGATPTSPPLVADYNCFGWTYDGSNDQGNTPLSQPSLGRADYAEAGKDLWWFEGDVLSYCSWTMPIYCVQQ